MSDEEGWGKEETCPSLCMIKLSKGGGGGGPPPALKMNVIVVALVVCILTFAWDLCPPEITLVPIERTIEMQSWGKSR